MAKKDCIKCEARVRAKERKQILSRTIPCYGGNRLILAKDVKCLKE